MYYPSLELFKERSRKGNLIPVYRKVIADMETPVSIFKKVDCGQYSFLLESMEGGEKWARYSFIGLKPSFIFKSKGRRVELIRNGASHLKEVDDPLNYLKEILSTYQPVETKELPRFYGGVVGFVSYDQVRFFELLPDTVPDDMEFSDNIFILPNIVLIYDNFKQDICVVYNAYVDSADKAESVYHQAIGEIDNVITDLKRPALRSGRPKAGPKKISIDANMSREAFSGIVDKAKSYIRKGDIIQAVLSQRFQCRNHIPPFTIYRALRRINPSPYLFYLRFDDEILVGSSPEVLVRVEDSRIELRPIAGTRPRGTSPTEEEALEQDLLDDPKERAEHIMLVDLGRNDVGRVAQYGSVCVNELMTIERYSHVMHIVSNIQGKLKSGKDAFDVFKACFPAGTVTGAPKIRAMEIIEELETTKRGPYAGAVGYFSFSGNMDFCITIRTLMIKGHKIYFQVGAGIVADSDAKKEYKETINKAMAMKGALELSIKGIL
ncbi:MAG: Anthranilate synthase component 1 [Syntrophomonadaceae bacterium]|nr:Anthranilate synthase component 1 [Bacillota bacterium]